MAAIEPLTATTSLLALSVSIATAWLTLFRRGSLLMTQPTVIFFGPDGGTETRAPRPKVFLRALLFATSKRGRVVESLHVRLSRGESRQNFNIWVYGDEKLVRGSGLYVGEQGVATNHHFLLPEDAPPFIFSPGNYRVEVFARILNQKRHRCLFTQDLLVTSDQADDLGKPNAGLYFDWGPDSASYCAHIDVRAPRQLNESMVDFLGSALADQEGGQGLPAGPPRTI